MKKKTLDIAINLLPEDPFFDTLVGKSMRWAVSVGRYIVIFTELIVIISFGTRFSLDRQLTDLNDSIHQKESIIKSFGSLETDIRGIQTRIAEYQQLQQRTNLAEVFPVLTSVIPRDVTLTLLSIQPTSVTITGTTLSQTSLNLLINNVQLTQKFKDVKIDRIESNPDTAGEIQFTLTAQTGNAPTMTQPILQTQPTKTTL